MPRANRYFLPDHVWHITHRCHKKEFLLKFAKDRKLWLHWLFEARGYIREIKESVSLICDFKESDPMVHSHWLTTGLLRYNPAGEGRGDSGCGPDERKARCFLG